MEDRGQIARMVGLAAAAVLAAACFLVLRPFISSLLWAIILVYCTWPAFRFLTDRVRLKPGMAALVMVLLEFTLVVLPILLAAPTRREDIEDIRGLIERGITAGPPEVGRLLERLPLVGQRLANGGTRSPST
jgi:predicted PurR-regulated permease PerM